MKTTVIVTTYNRPDALDSVVRGFFLQKDIDFDLVVADDGSDQQTRDIISRLSLEAPFEISHVWHEDLGFRAAAIRNKAIKASQGEYLIFTDGDCIPRANFVVNHKKLAEKGYFLSGSRVLLSRKLTQDILTKAAGLGHWDTWTILRHYCARDINRVLPLFSSVWLMPYRKSSPKRWEGVKTCNFSSWKSDLFGVNGFDEQYRGWGLEDSDLVVRLLKSGVKHKNARQATPTLHLWHPENDRGGLERNSQMLRAIMSSGRIEANVGLRQIDC
ncbi:glycosyltransferase family 2 protein [Burkholderiales bacterium]|nr:glycosyltransferase family 2 protein [Burkholderiales bacterium]